MLSLVKQLSGIHLMARIVIWYYGDIQMINKHSPPVYSSKTHLARSDKITYNEANKDYYYLFCIGCDIY